MDLSNVLTEIESLVGLASGPAAKQLTSIFASFVSTLPAIEAGTVKAQPFVQAAWRVATTGGIGLTQQEWLDQKTNLDALSSAIDAEVAADQAAEAGDPNPTLGPNETNPLAPSSLVP